MDTKLVSELTMWERIKSPLPLFFKKLSYFGGFLVALTTPVIASVVPLSEKFTMVATYLNIIGLTIVAVSKFTVDQDNEKIIT